MKITGVVSFLLVAVLALQRCKQPYVSPYVSPATGYLVVEGYISGNTPTSFLLSRTVPLSSGTTSPPEANAGVQVEGDDNSIYPLSAQGNGVYGSVGNLSLNASVNYRLRITTQSGGQYLSDYAQYKVTPPIDSVNWVQNGAGVSIYANAHDDAGTTRYYQWDFDETWEYHSAEYAELEYVPDTIVLRPAADQIYRCWHNDGSNQILIASTEKLSKDLVYEQPLQQIPANSVQISVLYSILVRQYALTEGGYNFLSLMQKNTESLGTIFDPQPSQLVGNIHCLTNPAEPVIGYVSAGTVQQQRIFIQQDQVTNWFYSYTCPMKDTILPGTEKSLSQNFASQVFTPVAAAPHNMYSANYTSCLDCTFQGGTTDKPSYWPN